MKDTDSLSVEAEKLLARMPLVPPREPGEKLRAADEAKILELHAAGKTQTDIARVIGCHQSTVSRTIAEYDDSRPLARKYLESRALEMTRRLVTDAKPETILRVLGKLDVVRDDGTGGSDDYGPTVYVGIGLTMQGTGDQALRNSRVLSPAELFQPSDVIVLWDGLQLEGLPSSQQLMVDRDLGHGTRTLCALRCSPEEIPPHVRITPEALEFIREHGVAT
jgi:hypothetical protein